MPARLFEKKSAHQILPVDNNRDISRLIKRLGHADPAVRCQAAEMLAAAKTDTFPALIAAAHSPDVSITLGIISFFSRYRIVRSLPYLIGIVGGEGSAEIRLAAVYALGELGNREAVPTLLPLLKGNDRYLRYAAAKVLPRLGWVPKNPEEKAYVFIALQDWGSVRSLGAAAMPALEAIFASGDTDTRAAILSVVPGAKDIHAQQICREALESADAQTRWIAMNTAMNCGIAPVQVPLLQAWHRRTGPDPLAAAILNFLFLGIGYNYLGKWWGFPVFMLYMSVLVLAQLATGPFLPYCVAFPITALFAVHTYRWAEQISDREV